MNAQQRTLADLKTGMNVQIDKNGRIRQSHPQMGLPSVDIIDKSQNAALLEALAEVMYTVHVMEAGLTTAWNKQTDATKQIWRDKAIRKAS